VRGGELRTRLESDGVSYGAADLPAALALLESNGEFGNYDTALPGLPYKILRPIPDTLAGSDSVTATPVTFSCAHPVAGVLTRARESRQVRARRFSAGGARAPGR
jgi:hypothetical protein